MLPRHPQRALARISIAALARLARVTEHTVSTYEWGRDGAITDEDRVRLERVYRVLGELVDVANGGA